MLVLGALVLVLSIAAGDRIYKEATQAIQAEAAAMDAQRGAVRGQDSVSSVVERTRAWVQKMNFASVASNAALGAVMTLGLFWCRRRFLGRLTAATQECKEKAQRLQEATFQVQRLTSEKIKIADELRTLQSELDRRIEERTASLAKAHAALEQELNERRQAEKMMTLQSKELERSKGVLELHVQARAQELQKLQRRNESILNSAGEGIYGLDLQGRMTFVNPATAKLTGWKVEELVGRLEREVFNPATPTGEPDDKAADGEPLTDRLFCRRDGSTFQVEYVRTPIKENERAVGEVVIFKDITERKHTEEVLARKAEELARSNAELEQFAFVASHDLQEPLRKIQAFGDRLKTKMDAAQLTEGRDYLERMQSAAARMRTLINDLLTFSRVISASRPFVSVDLNKVVKDVLTDLEVHIEQTKAQVEVGELPTIDADPMQMRQLFQNLIGNALKFQPPNQAPVVCIRSRLLPTLTPVGSDREADGATCEIAVQDNGIGFEEKYMDKIFAVFQRLHGRSEFEGTGVGLAVCRRITDRHGGTITAQSKLGEGATFIVCLPVRQASQSLPEGPAATEELMAA
jgi:PAS domain S-box-containing protein